jgi:cyclase
VIKNKKKRFIRIIPKLDIKNGMLIKGINLEGLRVLGDPIDFANYYYKSLADEICYIDNVATLYGTNNLANYVLHTAKNIFIPLSVGGGIRSLKDIERMLNAGADKICINSAAIENLKFIRDASRIFGSANISVIIEYTNLNNKLFITKSTGRDLVNTSPFEWAKIVEQEGAGEIFLTSVNHEGLKSGFDIKTIKKISKNVSIPVVAHGGAGNINHIIEVVKKTDVTGIALSGLLHYEVASSFQNKRFKIGNLNYLENLKKQRKVKINLIKKIKESLRKENYEVRL